MLVNNLYFIRPKPEETFEDMPVFLIAANDKERCWELLLEDMNGSIGKWYVIAEEFAITNPIKEGVIWGTCCLL